MNIPFYVRIKCERVGRMRGWVGSRDKGHAVGWDKEDSNIHIEGRPVIKSYVKTLKRGNPYDEEE